MYKLEEMTTPIWNDIRQKIPEEWMNAAIRQGWPEVIQGDGIAFNETGNSWLCRSPVLIRHGNFAWYLFHLDGDTYCFRIRSPSRPLVQFIHGDPNPNVRAKVEGALQEAFRAYGFYGLPDHDLTELAPVFL